MDSPTKQEIAEIFKKLQSKRENRVCLFSAFIMSRSASIAMPKVLLGLQSHLGCTCASIALLSTETLVSTLVSSGESIAGGIILTAVQMTLVDKRSTNLDSWTWEQLRTMKVGGNGNAADFFRQHGSSFTDAKTKFSSRVAQLYKEKLAQKVREDVARYPNKVIIEGEFEDFDKPAVKPDDFFDEANWSSPNVSARSSPVPPGLAALPTVAQQPSSRKQQVTEVSPSADNVEFSGERRVSASQVKKLLSSTADEPSDTSNLSSTTSSSTAGKKKGGKLGVKKVAAGLNFDEMEAKAKEEAAKREELIKQGLLDIEKEKEKSKAAVVQPVPKSYQSGAKNAATPNSAHTERLGMGVAKLSFGATANPAAEESKRFGFGSSGPAVPEETGAREKFSGAKAISSDMYFGRNAHAPIDAESLARLQQFQGAQSISSDQFYGNDSSENSRSSKPIANMELSDAIQAAQSALGDAGKKFIDDAAADLSSGKEVVVNVANKLGDFLRDMQNRY